MTTVPQSWQSVWEDSIKHSSLNHGQTGFSERERLNMIAEVSLRNNGDRLYQTDPKKKAELDEEINRLRRFINKESSVLDIGAGYGRVAIPLSKEVEKMTVVEPAHPFMNRLKDDARQEEANNIEFAEVLWSDFHLQEKYDLVYSSWSPAVGNPAALMKMHEASRGYCALELGATPQQKQEFFGQVYPFVTGENFRPTGNYLNILTTLYEHGIYANLEIREYESEIKHESMERTLSSWKALLEYYANTNGKTEVLLREFYRSRMNSDCTYTIPLIKGASCMLWWKV
ncbi:class I SAM-dependent methyltransferase [Methanothrix sp.]|uniref:class I SAM-dependent methyltransferase n=1 Tax=Methanothrix sp. TaxID=90426 RepID=UPI003BB560F6